MSLTSWHTHYINKNHANQRPTRYVFVDVETNQEVVNHTRSYTKHTLKLGVACAVVWKKGREPQEKWFNFEHATHFWEWLKQWQRKRDVLWVVAHNSAFDLTILDFWRKLECNEYVTSRPGKEYIDSRTGERRTSGEWRGLLAIDGIPFHVETEANGCRVNFSDLQNYYPCRLSEIGKMVGIEKGTWDDVRQSETDLRFYCHNDVEILKRAYLGLVSRWEHSSNGNWKFSSAGLAYSHYRHKYMNAKIAIHDNETASELEWAAIYGGEVRCWYKGKVDRKLVHVDVNSLYPAMMVDCEYPTALIDVLCKPRSGLVASLIDRYAIVAKVTLRTKRDHYPYRTETGTVYPVGRFTTTLAGPEFISAFESGDIFDCDWVCLYTHANLFKRYVLEWWEEKRRCTSQGDNAGAAFAKLMLNSLSGKFAQRMPQWETDNSVDVVRPWKVFPHLNNKTGRRCIARSVGWIGQVCTTRVPCENSFPAIFAYVTSYARERMRKLRESVAPSHLFYQDTDSLIVTKEWFDAESEQCWPIGTGLGQLRVVGEYSESEFRGLKNYSLGSRRVIAGIKERDNSNGDGSYTGERFERVSHLFVRSPDATLRSKIVDVSAKGDGGTLEYGDDGWSIPLRLPSGMPDEVFAEIGEKRVK